MKRILTGVKPTGLPHIGNYFGAIKPALNLAQNYQSFFFIADYHALTTVRSKKLMETYSFQIAAAWLAFGLNPLKSVFYKQSSIPEIFELMWILSCFSAKGLLNRSHAYKALVDENQRQGIDLDKNINHGLFSYPVLMAADILLFNTHFVPVGADQKQHIEIARDIAETLNHNYGDILVVPEPLIEDSVQVIPGIDGRKMSKNYDNTIPVFLPEKQLRKRVMQIVTDSTPVDEPKNPDTCHVFQLLKYFLNPSELSSMDLKYRQGGVGYGEVKQYLFESIIQTFGQARERYEFYVENPAEVKQVLEEGSKQAQEISHQTLKRVKAAIGI